MNLKTMEGRKHIKFHNKRIIPYMFYMRIDKNNKVIKTIREKYKSEAPNITKD